MGKKKHDFGTPSQAKNYRVKQKLVKKIKNKQREYIVERKEAVDEAEIVNALILKGLENVQLSDIDKYLELRELGEIK